jgi:hypothetical protein
MKLTKKDREISRMDVLGSTFGQLVADAEDDRPGLPPLELRGAAAMGLLVSAGWVFGMHRRWNLVAYGMV